MEEPLFDHIVVKSGTTLTSGYQWCLDRSGEAVGWTQAATAALLPEDVWTPVDLTGWSAAWVVTTLDGTPVLAMTTGNGKLAALGADGVIAPAPPGVGPPDTSLPTGLYDMTLRLSDPAGRITELVCGKWQA